MTMNIPIKYIGESKLPHDAKSLITKRIQLEFEIDGNPFNLESYSEFDEIIIKVIPKPYTKQHTVVTNFIEKDKK